ncbi:MAG TPA: sensor histidine kinase KdpD [Vicinamibacteria bacterium]|jgi:two-component system sensor histidine kinase KdpD
MDERRPDPDALLERVRAEDRPRTRGRLKVFFGASPGVGKTYAMLDAAQRARAAGRDVVVGWVETHGRAETARLLEGLERLPPRSVEHRGVVLQEMDLDAALARRPGLLLVDELAHTNVPGSRHLKRWQDVQELLDAGLDVWTTLNVQHLESLNDVVARITEVAQRETVPDHLLEGADEVEFVDLPPEELLQRLREGRVYVPEQAQRAVSSFFRKGNLTALRELALRRTADHVDQSVRDYRRAHAIEDTWPVAERILVCIRPNPESGRLIRAARRLAGSLRAEWIVASVESPSQPALTAEERQELAAAFKLAEELGAETAVLSGASVGEALLEHARERNVSKIVVGKPARQGWRARLRGSPVEAIIRASGEIDVYAISGEPDDRLPRHAPGRRQPVPPHAYGWAVGAVLVCTLVSWAMFPHFDKSNLIMVYLLGVAVVATRFGRGPSALAASLSVAAFDFFFVPPHLTFAVTDTQYVLTFAVMLLVGLLISTLAVRVREQGEAARQRERRTQILFATSRDLASLRVPEEIARAAVRHVSEVMQGPGIVYLPDGKGRLAPASPAPEFPDDARERAVAEWSFRHGRPAGLGTDTLPGASGLYLPLPEAQGPLGVLGVRPHENLRPLSPEHLDLLETMARQVAAPLERSRLAAETERARLEAERERLRGTLLGSVSHDLRTPLSAITGAASSLLEQPSLPADARRDLTETIHEEAVRLNRLVTNLLDMSRLEAGGVRLEREWQPLEEVVGASIGLLEKLLDGRRIETALPEDLPLVPFDAVLLQQVLVNLLENAIKYTPPATTILVGARLADGAVEVEVADDGPGLPPGTEDRVFEKFYRDTRTGRGFGLGLAICQAIVGAHGGRIWAEKRAPRGVSFRFTLPLGGAPPPPAEGADELDHA